MKVRDLIKRLADFNGDEDVYIGLGSSTIPNGLSDVHSVGDFTTTLPTNGNFGVYIIPSDNLNLVSHD